MFDFHVAVSDYTAAELIEANKGHTRHRREVWVCPMGVDSDQFRLPDEPRRLRREWTTRFNCGDSTVLLLYVGRLAAEKNLDLLVETLAALGADQQREYRLLIAGDGPRRAVLAAGLEKIAPGRAVFLGHISDRSGLAQLYAATDMFVHPNPREPFGIAPLEAMASGLPLVAPRQGGVLSFANDANAWLAEPRGESFANAIREAIEHPEARAAKCALARETAESLGWERVTASYFALYDRLHAKFQRWQVGEAARPGFPTAPPATHPQTGSHRPARLVYAWNDVFR